MIKLIEKAKLTHSLTKDEIVRILADDSVNDILFKTADEVRHDFVGDEVYLRALIEFSNFCRCNCKYCGIRAENRHALRYRLDRREILDFARNAVDSGYKTIVLQSGEDIYFKADYLAEIVREIKAINPRPLRERKELLSEHSELSNSGEGESIALTLSIGERSYDEYKVLKDAGADRFLLRIETTDKDLYEKMHPKASFENRKRCLYDLKKLGFETGTGCLVGLPEQTLNTLADDILFFKELNADMIGIGPFIPHPETPLKDCKRGSFTLALKVMALTRLLLPDINIPATTAMETINPNGRLIALQSGANVVMPNVTESDYRKKYEIYPDKACVDYAELVEKLRLIGRTVLNSRGSRGGKNE